MKKVVWLFLSAALVLAVCVPALCGEVPAIRVRWQYPEGVQLVLPDMKECPQGQAVVRLYNQRDELVSTAALAYSDMASVNVYENHAFDLLGTVDFSKEMTNNEAYYFEADLVGETIKSGNYFSGKGVPVECLFEATYSDCFDDRVYIGAKEFAYYYHFTKPSTNGKLQLKSECSAVSEYGMAGGQWLSMYEFVPVQPGEEAVSLKVCNADNEKCLYEVLITYSIDENLKVSFAGCKLYDCKNALGDADGSGELTANDASIALALSLDSRFGTRFSSGICDVDGNGIVSANDASCILQKVLNSDFVYPQESGKSLQFSS